MYVLQSREFIDLYFKDFNYHSFDKIFPEMNKTMIKIELLNKIKEKNRKNKLLKRCS